MMENESTNHACKLANALMIVWKLHHHGKPHGTTWLASMKKLCAASQPKEYRGWLMRKPLVASLPK